MKPRVLAGRLLAFLALLAGGLLALHFIAGDAPPPQDADLRPAPYAPKPGDAQPVFVAMGESLKLSASERDYIKKQLDAGATDWTTIDRLTAQNAAALALFERFSKLDHFDDPAHRDISKVDYRTPLPKFFPLMSSANLVALRAQRRLAAGRAREALADGLMIADAGQVLLRSRQPLLAALAGYALCDTGARVVHRAVAGGRLGAAELKAAAARLSAHQDGIAAGQEGLRFEYVSGANMLLDLASHEESVYRRLAAKHNFFYQPNATQALFAERFRPIIAEAAKPCLKSTAPPFKAAPMLGANFVGKAIYNVATPAYERLAKRRCESDFLRAAASVEAASAAFRLERGRAPRDLSELVPGYLARAPVDPFTGEPPPFTPAMGLIETAGLGAYGKPAAF